MLLVLFQFSFSEITWEPLWDGSYEANSGADKFPGWLVKDDDISTWFLEDSSITVNDPGTPAVGSVWYKRVFTEGTFEISYKIHDDMSGNGGIYLLGRPDGTQESDVDEAGTDLQIGTPDIYGMEVEMEPNHIGCLICNQCGFWMQHSPQEYTGISDKFDWIDLRMAVNGSNFRTWYRQTGATDWITGIDYDHESQISGRFGMEVYMGHLSFKNIQIAAGCSDPSSPRYDREAVEDLGWVLDDNGSCDEANWGCKDSAYTEYDASARFEDNSKCEIAAVGAVANNRTEVSLTSQLGAVVVRVGGSPLEKLEIRNIQGKLLWVKSALITGQYQFPLGPGLYLIHSQGPAGRQLETVAVP